MRILLKGFLLFDVRHSVPERGGEAAGPLVVIRFAPLLPLLLASTQAKAPRWTLQNRSFSRPDWSDAASEQANERTNEPGAQLSRLSQGRTGL